jgi:hypothetical protein
VYREVTDFKKKSNCPHVVASRLLKKTKTACCEGVVSEWPFSTACQRAIRHGIYYILEVS